MSPWLSIVIPTVGRPSLCDTLDAIDHQPPELLDGLEVLVVGDTYGGMTINLANVREHLESERPAGRYRFIEHDGGQHVFGQPQRTRGAQEARGDWVWFGQDDNIATNDALSSIAKAVGESRTGLLIFRWLAPWRERIWRWPELAVGNLDADGLVMARDLARSVTWGLRYEGDYDAAAEAYERTGRSEYVWQTPLVSIARPGESHKWWR